jgi:hypothetical protein
MDVIIYENSRLFNVGFGSASRQVAVLRARSYASVSSSSFSKSLRAPATLAPTSLLGEQDTEGLRFTVRADFVDVAAKVSRFTKTFVRDTTHLLKDCSRIRFAK